MLSLFAMSAFFSVPQAVEGLGGDVRKLRKAVFIGIFNNFILIVIITVCSLLASTEVTEVAMVGWSAGIGDWARIIGSVFTVLAMLTTYWSLSLALGGIVNDMMPLGDRGSWLFATAPSLLIALLGGADFLELMRIAGGLIAIMISVMVVPAYRNARNEEGSTLLPRGGTGLQIAVIACSNYILSAMDDEQRLPTREELDDWGGGRPVVVYTIDGHSTALSSAMLRLVGIDPEGHSGVLTGEENDRMQGRLTDALSAVITPAALARGIAAFENACAAYGISVVGALEGNGDSEKDPTTGLIVRLARHMDVGVRLYLQYTDLARVKPYLKWMRRPRVGGCGDWEMDGAAGSHSAAFSLPYRDSGETAECYYEQDFVDTLTAEADALGWQISSHAIGDRAIERLLTAYEKLPGGRLHRIEHCEFLTDELFERLRQGDYALMMQPGYSWIDKRYLHSYESFLPEEILSSLRFRSLLDAGLCVCGSSDSPVQELDPWLQMLGMVQFYREEESVTPFDALRCYTVNPARALGEENERGTLEAGKAADFFTAERDFFTLSPAEIAAFRPEETYYGGVKYRPRRGSLPELAAMLLRKPRMI